MARNCGLGDRLVHVRGPEGVRTSRRQAERPDIGTDALAATYVVDAGALEVLRLTELASCAG